MTNRGRSLPSGPLIAYLRRRWPDGNDVQWAMQCNVDRTIFMRWRTGANIGFVNVERICAELGVHPSYLWGWEQYEHASRPPRTAAERRAFDRERQRHRRQEQRCHAFHSTA